MQERALKETPIIRNSRILGVGKKNKKKKKKTTATANEQANKQKQSKTNSLEGKTVPIDSFRN